MVVSRFKCGGGVCQSNEVGVAARTLWSMDSIPCIGALTWAASCASNWCIRPSRASLCSLHMGQRCPTTTARHAAELAMTDDATTSRGFCVLTHCNEKRLQVAQGVSPSHLILRRRHLSHALDTDFLLGCQSLTAVGEKRLGPSPAGRVAARISNYTVQVAAKTN